MKALLLVLFVGVPLLHGASQFVAAGVVVDSATHQPLAHARVWFAPTQRAQKLEQVTKQDGRFSFVVEQAGKYDLQMYKPGYPAQSYRRSGIGGLSSAIAVRDDQDTSHIVFEANRGGAITGVIKDDDSEPVANAGITVFQSSVVNGERKVIQRGQTRANAAGEFRLAGLPLGNYYVCATGRPWFADFVIMAQLLQEASKDTPRPEADAKLQPIPVDPSFRGSGFVTTFYPHAETAEDAALVHLETGGEVRIAISLRFAKAVTLKGSVASPGHASAGSASLYQKFFDQYLLFGNAAVAADGTFEFQNVPAGSYQIAAGSGTAFGPSSWNVLQPVEVGSSDAEVSLRPDYLGAVSGHVLFEGARPSNSPALLVSLRNDQGILRRIQVDADGNYSFSRMPMGKYEMLVGSTEYVGAYLTDAAGQHLPLTVEISSGEPLHRDVTLTRAVSVIDGSVENSGTPQVGCFVLLLPKDAAHRWAYRLDQTDSDGSFRLGTIPAGDYYLIALSDGSEVAYRDSKVAAILARSAKPVHIDAADHLAMKIDVVSTAALHLP
jgi:hypothetical protein